MIFPKRKYIIPGCILLVLAAVCLLIAAALPKPLHNQKQAERWAGESGAEFAQFSCFLSPSDVLNEEDIYTLRQKIDEKLTAESYETPQGGVSFCDAWSAAGTLTVSGPRGSFDTAALAVGGSFFDFHPLTLLSGGYLAESDLMKDRVVLDEQLAWMLFGGRDLAGMTVTIAGQDYIVAGVAALESDRATRAVADEAPMLFLAYGDRTLLSEAGETCYEVVLPEPVEGFAGAMLEECFPIGGGVLQQNTGRFSFAGSAALLRQLGKLGVRTQAVQFPYWENAALYTETRCALFRGAGLLCLPYPAALACIVLLRLLKKGKSKLRSGGAAIRGKLLDKRDERRMRLYSGSGSHLK